MDGCFWELDCDAESVLILLFWTTFMQQHLDYGSYQQAAAVSLKGLETKTIYNARAISKADMTGWSGSSRREETIRQWPEVDIELKLRLS